MNSKKHPKPRLKCNRLIVHTGMGKTGTSAIQDSLNRSTETLNSNQMVYLGMWPAFTQGNKAIPGKKLSQPGHQFLSAVPPKKGADRIAAHLKKLTATTAIWSNESIHCNSITMSAVCRELERRGYVVERVCYVREPAYWLVSAYEQWALLHKSNQGPVPDLYEFSEDYLIKQYNKLRDWLPEIQILKYDENSDVVSSFSEYIGVALNQPKRRINGRKSTAQLLTHAMYNNEFESPVLPQKLTHPDPLIDQFDRFFNRERLQEIISRRRPFFDSLMNQCGIKFHYNHPPLLREFDDSVFRELLNLAVTKTYQQAAEISKLKEVLQIQQHRLAALEKDH